MEPAARFEGRAVIVTGAASGIGRATAARFAREGAAVTVADIDEAGAARTVEEIGSAGGTARLQITDVTDEEAVRRMVEETLVAFGRIDVLHNNAAAIQLNFEDQDVVSGDLATWERVLSVNFRGVLLGCRCVLPEMVARGGGAIVNTASAAAFYGESRLAAYAASKAAVVSLTKSIATAYGDRNVRCNAVAPGIVVEPGLQEQIGGPNGPHLQKLTAAHVLDRVGAPEEVAAAVAFLASDDGGFVTGEILRVDGGFTAHGPTFTTTHLERLRDGGGG